MEGRNIDSQDELINPNRRRLRYIDHHIRPNCFQLSKRYTLAILVHIGFLIIFAMRNNVCFFNVEILAKLYQNETYIDKAIHIQRSMDEWFILAFVLVQIPAAILTYKYPSQRVFGICILASSITAIIESFSLNWVSFEFGYAAFFQGLAQSASIPAVFGILYEWAPPSERATLISIVYSGTFMGVLFGVVFSNLVCGYFEEEHLLALYGIAGIIWYLAWIWLVFERPEDHPTITDSEFEYLKRHIEVPKTKPPIRWGKIFSSMPCWALFVVHLCRSFNTHYLVQINYTQFNYFFYDDRFLSVELPSLVMIIIVPASGYLADIISEKTSLSITAIRKYYICGGLLFEVIAYLPSLFLKEDSFPYIVDNRVIDLICYGFTISAYFVNYLDIAPIYACVSMAIGNILGSFLTGYLIESGRKPSGNEIFFFFMLAIHLFGFIFYGIWGSGEVQPWAKTNFEENERNSTSNRHNGIENPV